MEDQAKENIGVVTSNVANETIAAPETSNSGMPQLSPTAGAAEISTTPLGGANSPAGSISAETVTPDQTINSQKEGFVGKLWSSFKKAF